MSAARRCVAPRAARAVKNSRLRGGQILVDTVRLSYGGGQLGVDTYLRPARQNLVVGDFFYATAGADLLADRQKAYDLFRMYQSGRFGDVLAEYVKVHVDSTAALACAMRDLALAMANNQAAPLADQMAAAMFAVVYDIPRDGATPPSQCTGQHCLDDAQYACLRGVASLAEQEYRACVYGFQDGAEVSHTALLLAKIVDVLTGAPVGFPAGTPPFLDGPERAAALASTLTWASLRKCLLALPDPVGPPAGGAQGSDLWRAVRELRLRCGNIAVIQPAPPPPAPPPPPPPPQPVFPGPPAYQAPPVGAPAALPPMPAAGPPPHGGIAFPRFHESRFLRGLIWLLVQHPQAPVPQARLQPRGGVAWAGAAFEAAPPPPPVVWPPAADVATLQDSGAADLHRLPFRLGSLWLAIAASHGAGDLIDLPRRDAMGQVPIVEGVVADYDAALLAQAGAPVAAAAAPPRTGRP